MKKKVVLLGDSIRLLGYGTVIDKYLGDEFDLWQSEDNDRFSYYTLRNVMFEYQQYIKDADIIHWNNGLWDLTFNPHDSDTFVDIEQYKIVMCRIADILLKITPKVIFATTTPVRKENPWDDNEVIKKYNSAIVPLLKEKGITINDLNESISKDIEKYIREDDLIHLTDEGIALAARQTAELIKEIA